MSFYDGFRDRTVKNACWTRPTFKPRLIFISGFEFAHLNYVMITLLQGT